MGVRARLRRSASLQILAKPSYCCGLRLATHPDRIPHTFIRDHEHVLSDTAAHPAVLRCNPKHPKLPVGLGAIFFCTVFFPQRTVAAKQHFLINCTLLTRILLPPQL